MALGINQGWRCSLDWIVDIRTESDQMHKLPGEKVYDISVFVTEWTADRDPC